MKKTISMIAVATISFGSINAFAAAPVQTQQDTTVKKKTVKRKVVKTHKVAKKVKRDTTKM